MGDSPLMLGVSGMRGIVGRSLTPEVAVRYAAAFGAWLRAHRGGMPGPVVVGRDGRAGGELMYHAAITGLLSAGWEVAPLGVATTPAVGVAVDLEDSPGGMVITASHNPQEWNGLKCLVAAGAGESAGARAPSKDEAEAIIGLYRSGGVAAGGEVGEVVEAGDAAVEHAEMVLGAMIGAGLEADPDVRVVLDSVNSSGARASEAFLWALGVSMVQLFGDGSGVFPHVPEPTAENLSGDGGLCGAVPGLKAQVGFAQDPDADRLAIIDENGAYIGEEYTLALCAHAVLSQMEDAAGSVLVANLSTSRMVEDVAARFGARVERTAVGEANVVERMKSLLAGGERVVLGGEGNGGVIWPEVVFVRDSIGSMALVLSLMASRGKTVSELVAEVDAMGAGGGGYAIEKRKVGIASKADAEPAVEKIAGYWAGERVDRQDGVRVDFSGAREGAWVHVRASNTEPIMRLIAEAPTAEGARAILDEAAGVIG